MDFKLSLEKLLWLSNDEMASQVKEKSKSCRIPAHQEAEWTPPGQIPRKLAMNLKAKQKKWGEPERSWPGL
jgi:hypothetical protein